MNANQSTIVQGQLIEKQIIPLTLIVCVLGGFDKIQTKGLEKFSF